MQKISLEIHNKPGESWVYDFLQGLSLEERDKVITRLIKYENEYTLQELKKARQIIKLTGYGRLYEVRIPIKDRRLRLLGPMHGNTLIFVNVFIKKSDKTPKRELKITEKRSKQIKI